MIAEDEEDIGGANVEKVGNSALLGDIDAAGEEQCRHLWSVEQGD